MNPLAIATALAQLIPAAMSAFNEIRSALSPQDQATLDAQIDAADKQRLTSWAVADAVLEAASKQ